MQVVPVPSRRRCFPTPEFDLAEVNNASQAPSGGNRPDRTVRSPTCPLIASPDRAGDCPTDRGQPVPPRSSAITQPVPVIGLPHCYPKQDVTRKSTPPSSIIRRRRQSLFPARLWLGCPSLSYESVLWIKKSKQLPSIKHSQVHACNSHPFRLQRMMVRLSCHLCHIPSLKSLPSLHIFVTLNYFFNSIVCRPIGW